MATALTQPERGGGRGGEENREVEGRGKREEKEEREGKGREEERRRRSNNPPAILHA